MKFPSSTDPSVKTSDIIFLKYGGLRIIVPMPPTYEGVVAVAKRNFHLPEGSGVQLLTNGLVDGLAGLNNAIISEEAWAVIKSDLVGVEVRLVELKEPKEPKMKPANASEAGPSLSQPSASSQETKVPSQPEENPPAKRKISNARPPSSRTSQVLSKTPTTSKLASKPASKPASKYVAKPASSASKLNTSRLSAQPESSKKPAKQPRQEPTLDALEEEDPAPRSPAKKSAKRRIVDSDAEGEASDEGPGVSGGSAKRRRMSDEEAAEVENEVVVMEERVPVKEEAKPKVAAKPAVTRMEGLKASVLRASPVKTPKREPASMRQAWLDASTPDRKPKANGAYDPDASFVICVVNGNGPEDEENGSQFKTKNKHMIRKVLWTACRTFACQDDYDRLGLFMRNEEGEHFCPEDKTVGELGITSETDLAIRYLDDDEEEY